MPYLPVHIQAPNFACSAFCATDTAGEVLMGRNYDFKNDTSAMLVYCTPEKGYKSVAMGALDNICANSPDSGSTRKITCLTAPFLCLDGMNEKGVSIAVLTLDSEPTYQKTGRPVIGPVLAIRLILTARPRPKRSLLNCLKATICSPPADATTISMLPTPPETAGSSNTTAPVPGSKASRNAGTDSHQFLRDSQRSCASEPEKRDLRPWQGTLR